MTTTMQRGIDEFAVKVQQRRAQLIAAGQWVEEPAAAAPVYQCAVCEDKGSIVPNVPFGDVLFGKVIDCPALGCATAAANRQRRADVFLKSSSVPDKFKALTFTTWYSLPDAQRAGKELAAAAGWAFASAAPSCAFSLFEAAQAAGIKSRAYDDEQRSWLVLQGDMGLGKTGIASAIVREMTWQGHSIYFYRLAELFKDIQRGYTDGTSDSTLNAVQNAPALVLDEFNISTGADGKATADKQRLLEEIIRFRHARSLPTVITCNYDLRALTSMWGERTMDVVSEAAHWIVLAGPKIRRGVKPVVSS